MDPAKLAYKQQAEREASALIELIGESATKVADDLRTLLPPAMRGVTGALLAVWRNDVIQFSVDPSMIASNTNVVDAATGKLIWIVYELGRRAERAGLLLTPTDPFLEE